MSRINARFSATLAFEAKIHGMEIHSREQEIEADDISEVDEARVERAMKRAVEDKKREFASKTG